MKFFVVKKKTMLVSWAVILVAVLTIVILSLNENTVGVYFGISNKKMPIHNIKTEEKHIALTFDTAYGTDKTEGIIELLKEYEADSTFFLTGDWVENFPEKIQKIVDAGFEIGTHSNTHPHMTRLKAEDINNELRVSKEKIGFYTKVPVTLFRAPFGEYSDKVIESAESLNLKTIQWNIDSLDWKNVSSKDVIDRVTSKAKSGSIILFHTNSENILNILPAVLLGLKNKGFSFKRVSDMIYTENYRIDNNGMQYLLS